ncbi:hypothetical protein [Sediminibacterium soli]|uniref:hypothetical protein n=1 Tax=Sediminibacterium soli TaxID=2698829 RepID=UPI00137ACE29|nr:hypothetical protein [Sediminibacterium soli]NCI47396.1 hypothetical protein [Sediminibacterium soli]
MRKTAIILTVLLLLATAAYLFLRYYLLRAPDYRPDLSKARSALDLRPVLIAKLQQIVKDGSGGLYRLSVDSLEPHLSDETLVLVNVKIRADSSVLNALDSMRQAPDDVYAIACRKITLEGLGIADLVNTRHINLQCIRISYPEWTVYRKLRSYHTAVKPSPDTMGLYRRMAKHFVHAAVDSILVDHGIFVGRNLSQPDRDTRFDHISVSLKNILIDSLAAADQNRFLFSEKAAISCGRMQKRTADSLYLFTIDSFLLDTKARKLTALGLSLLPRGSRAFFRKNRRYRGNRFEIRAPRLVLSNMHWRQLLDNGVLQCAVMDVYGGYLNDFVDGSLPARPRIHTDNFPYQALRKLFLPLNIPRVNIRGFRVAYSEYYAPSDRSGTLYFDGINGRIDNLISTPGAAARGRWCALDARTRFMHSIPGRIRMRFDMNRYRSGVYEVDIRTGGFDGTLLNPLTENLGLFTIKQGMADSCRIAIRGDNDRTTATVNMQYHDLHITALKKKDGEDALKKKRFTNFFMNLFVIKNSNPGKNEPVREPVFTLDRDNRMSFFNFSWRVMRHGIMSTVGIPERLIPK